MENAERRGQGLRYDCTLCLSKVAVLKIRFLHRTQNQHNPSPFPRLSAFPFPRFSAFTLVTSNWRYFNQWRTLVAQSKGIGSNARQQSLTLFNPFQGGFQAMVKHVMRVAVWLALSTVAWAQNAPAAGAPPPPAVKTHLKVGDAAPDFNLPGTDGKNYTLSQFKGQKNVVLAVYFFAFTGG
jgi:hypothetical protein